jgi:diadenosine tetraphosphate (Ap4A) HIT family hydrolase
MPGSEENKIGESECSLPGFGTIEPNRVLSEDELFVIISDKYPVSPGHSLIIVKRAVSRFQQLTKEEKDRLTHWIDWCITYLQETLNPHPDGFNVGLNDGPPAGQTVSQLHVHIIPRYHGDIEDPRGGVRFVIPKKAKYWD